MTPPMSDLLRAASVQAVPVVRAVDDGWLGAPTPCAEYDVRALLNHLFAVVVNFQPLAAKKDADLAAAPDRLTGDWRDRFAGETVRLAEAWAAPGAEDGVTGRMSMPARTVAGLALMDLTVHAWDLARATGGGFTPDPECVRELDRLLAEMGPAGRRMGAFGDPVPVPEGATGFERLLAGTGRDPRWSPPV